MHPYYGIWKFPPKNARELINEEIRYLKATAGQLALDVLVREGACDVILLGDSPEPDKARARTYKEYLEKFVEQKIVPMYNHMQALKSINRYG